MDNSTLFHECKWKKHDKMIIIIIITMAIHMDNSTLFHECKWNSHLMLI
jgi:hypothetical protein